MKILMTGASGLLGSNLRLSADRPSRQQMDLTDYPITWDISNDYDLIVHCAAYTDVQNAETDKLKCFDINVSGTLKILNAFPTVPIVYISSEYANKPKNFYSLTKQMAEQLIKRHPTFLIIRTLFKKNPWPFEKAFTDAFTNGDYVDVIAEMIDKEIMNWNRKGQTMIYVGTGRKTLYELAIRTKPDVIPNSYKEMKVPIPSDYI